MEISENYLTNRVTGEIGQATAIYFPTSQEDVVELMQAVRKIIRN
jgi:glycolate oxidase